MIQITISILNYRTADMTIKSIEMVIDSLIPSTTLDWRIIVVDNDSKDGSEEKLRQTWKHSNEQQLVGWDNVTILQAGSNGGYSSGNNIAIRYTLQERPNTQYIHILNSDAFTQPNSIEALVHFLEDNQSYGIGGSRILNEDHTIDCGGFRFPNALSEFEEEIRLGLITRLLKSKLVSMPIPETTLAVDWVSGASFMVRVQTLHDIGLFDEEFFLYFEEVDLCKRALHKGWKTACIAESDVIHIGSASTGVREPTNIPTYWLDSRRRYYIKHHGKIYFYWTTLLRLTAGLIWFFRRKLEGKKHPGPKAFTRDLMIHTLFR